MSSWLSISLPNLFKSDNDQNLTSTLPSLGVKDDLSFLGHTIGRKLRCAAAFLAPPPPTQPQPPSESSSQALLGIRNDLVEIGGSFKSSLSLFSSNKAVSEISRFASNLLHFQNDSVNEFEGDEVGEEDENNDEVAGVTEEVLDFVEEISLRPECWTDFPLLLDADFNLSTAQKEHASTVEGLVPSLADLRHTSCNHLSVEKFWMIYFIFLLPRLREQDAKLLLTPEIVEARETLLQNLRNRRNAPVAESELINLSQEGIMDNNYQGEGSPSQHHEDLVETSSSQQRTEIDYANTISADTKKQPEKEEEISFSDLEDEENDENDIASRLSRLRLAKSEMGPSSNEWVRLNEHSGTHVACGQKGGQSTEEKDSEGEESNDWLTVDEGDLDSLWNV